MTIMAPLWIHITIFVTIVRDTESITVVPEPGATTVDVWGAVAASKKCGGGKIGGGVPDIPARAFMDMKGVVHMISGSTSYRHMMGPTLVNQTRSCKIAYNETGDPDPSRMAGDEFLTSSIAFDNGTVVTLVHTEFPGNVYNMSGGPSEPCKRERERGRDGRATREEKMPTELIHFLS